MLVWLHSISEAQVYWKLYTEHVPKQSVASISMGFAQVHPKLSSNPHPPRDINFIIVYQLPSYHYEENNSGFYVITY